MNAEAQRSLHDRPRNPDAVDLTMRGLALLNQPLTRRPLLTKPETYSSTRWLFILSVPDALAGAARVDMSDYIYGWSDQQDLYSRAIQRANQALLLNPDQAAAHYLKSTLIMLKAKSNDAASANEVIAEAEAQLRADPSFARAYHSMAVGEMFARPL